MGQRLGLHVPPGEKKFPEAGDLLVSPLQRLSLDSEALLQALRRDGPASPEKAGQPPVLLALGFLLADPVLDLLSKLDYCNVPGVAFLRPRATTAS